ncbi:hypothetical protein HRI_000705200 [Hibiscus trionum]|uniref:Uncharacterized protein n=1 Tax=Hibiscus trionum TaxID=183268 RepID=A0A9W7H3E7_HIBTR|nr:hypothetical protein HRI_000705200 [Hibiscus trionum]
MQAKRSRGRTPTPGRYQGLRDRRGQGHRRSRSYSPRRNDRNHHSRGRQGRLRSRSPYGRRCYDYDSYRKHKGHSLYGDGSEYDR